MGHKVEREAGAPGAPVIARRAQSPEHLAARRDALDAAAQTGVSEALNELLEARPTVGQAEDRPWRRACARVQRGGGTWRGAAWRGVVVRRGGGGARRGGGGGDGALERGENYLRELAVVVVVHDVGSDDDVERVQEPRLRIRAQRAALRQRFTAVERPIGRGGARCVEVAKVERARVGRARGGGGGGGGSSGRAEIAGDGRDGRGRRAEVTGDVALDDGDERGVVVGEGDAPAWEQRGGGEASDPEACARFGVRVGG